MHTTLNLKVTGFNLEKKLTFLKVYHCVWTMFDVGYSSVTCKEVMYTGLGIQGHGFNCLPPIY